MLLKNKVLLSGFLSFLAFGLNINTIYANVDDLSIRNRDTGKIYEFFDYMTNESLFFDLATGSDKYVVSSKGKWYEATKAISVTQGNTTLEQAINDGKITATDDKPDDESKYEFEVIGIE